MEENSMCRNVKINPAILTELPTNEGAQQQQQNPPPPPPPLPPPSQQVISSSSPKENHSIEGAPAPTTPTTSSTTHNHNGKGVHFKLATIAPPHTEPEELLGSVTMLNCPGTRASARVIQKMKQDLTRPMTPPPSEREHNKKEDKAAQKTPSQMRATNKTTWTNLERNCFFDALNEFGKDFEAVVNCINSKLKRRNTTSDYSFKTKDQVRQHYYQTYHKICKYVRFSDELKKPVQELYTLINYGEMRRKLQFLTEKHFMKLKHLVYQGHITVRCKGKNIRIKTPSCKALRRLNQLHDSLEDIRLPNKIEVVVSPANMEAFGRVQALAQNPRGRIIVPLHKKLITFIKTLQYKWRSSTAKLSEEKLFPSTETDSATAAAPAAAATTLVPPFNDPELCFLPKPGVAIHRPLLSITAYLSSVNICLTAYEERLGVKVRSDTLTQDRTSNPANSKRSRTESGSEKRSPDTKRPKPHGMNSGGGHDKSLDDLNASIKEEPVEPSTTDHSITAKPEHSSGDELSEEINEFLNASSTPGSNQAAAAAITPTQSRHKRGDAGSSNSQKGSRATAAAAARNVQSFRPLLSDEVIKRIRKGWTVSNAADITIGDLYVVLGQDSKLELEYYWGEVMPIASLTATSASSSSTTPASGSLPYNPHECGSVERIKAVTTASVSNKLKHLLLVANLSERVRKRQCSCGHICDRNMAAKSKKELLSKAQWLNSLGPGVSSDSSDSGGPGAIFRTPMPPMRRPIISLDPVRLASLTRQKLSRQVLVQRRILPPASVLEPYDLLEVRNGLFEPIERANSQIITSSSDIGPSPRPTSLDSLSSKTTSMSSQTSNISSSSAKNSPQHSQLEPQFKNYGSGNMDMPSLDFCVSSEPISLPDGNQDETTTQSFYNGSISPMHLLRESTSNARWLEDNINDFSLTSLLGHLDEIDASRDILDPSSNMSIISESSVDFRHKFQEIASLLQSQEKD